MSFWIPKSLYKIKPFIFFLAAIIIMATTRNITFVVIGLCRLHLVDAFVLERHRHSQLNILIL